MSSTQATKLGFLRTCMDRRFVIATRKAFEHVTDLEPTYYWHEAHAGGATKFLSDNAGVDYAFDQGARIFGWQAHLNGCGGQPGVSDVEIINRLHQTAEEMASKYREARHVFILASDNGRNVAEIIDKLYQAAEAMASKYLNALYVLVLASDKGINLAEVRHKLHQTAEAMASKYPDSRHVRILAINDTLNVQELPLEQKQSDELTPYQPAFTS